MDIELLVDSYDGSNTTSAVPHRILVPYICIQAICVVSGVIGNILVIGAVVMEKTLRIPGNIFILNLAIADLFITSFIDPFSITGAFTGEQFFFDRPHLCRFIGAMCITTCVASLLTLGAISFHRYIHICYHALHESLFTTRNVLLMCLGIWTTSVLIESPNLLGWGKHAYDRKQRMCMVDRSVLSYNYFFFFFAVGFPTVVIACCYLKIYLHVTRQKAKIQAHMSKQEHDMKRRQNDSARLARTLFLIFLLFVVCWMPYAIVVTVDTFDTFPLEVHLFAILCAHVNSCFNCIIYGATNRSFRRGYQKFLCMQSAHGPTEFTATDTDYPGHSVANGDTQMNPVKSQVSPPHQKEDASDA